MIQLFTVLYVCYIKYQNSIFDLWGNNVKYWDLLFWERGGYIQVIILLYESQFFPNVMEKLINNSIALVVCKSVKLLCSNFCTFLLFAFVNVCIKCVVSHS